MRRIPPVVVGLVLCAAIFLHAASVLASRDNDQFTIKRSELSREGQVYAQTVDMLFNTSSGGRLTLGTSTGSVNVATWSEEKVRLVVTKHARVTSMDDARRVLDMFRIRALQGGGDLSLSARARSRECADVVGVTFTIWVPKSYDVDIKTDSGDIDISEFAGKFTAHTGDGIITVDVDTDGLDIEVEDHTGEGGETFEGERMRMRGPSIE